ncbi:homoserine O-succinyltransferase [Veillonella montpellierensis DNF00314]|uniref:Homoserine O-acetyltransferase n=1 Tax=Veillonella montpellierensis DNF00314 TaxID=1401067 RepID=A0A096AII4_9FIRM|nr:homoserine O-succinyltransferase [Veillonella montpellierensis]KGF46928.1 homoserine O-succinyltransferase [Veillonella montpellierensis DNF00314]
MPVTVVKNLPAIEKLAQENIFVMDTIRAESQDIRPLNILVVNLMPTKEITETQLLRALSNTPLQLDVTFLHTASRTAKHVAESHLESFYRTFEEIKTKYFDGMIITGAPVELMDFEEVDYWQELSDIMNWSNSHVYSNLYICWGAQAAMYYHFGIHKKLLTSKLFGVFENEMYEDHPMLMRGMNEIFYMPHSRHTTVDMDEIQEHDELQVLAGSMETGAAIVRSLDNRHVFIFGHAEYDWNTLKLEYERDKALGLDIELPKNYYPDDDSTKRPIVRWKSTATILYTNWLNYYVYQETPFIANQIEKMKRIYVQR